MTTTETTTTTPIAQTTEAPKPKELSSPDLTFAEYETLRRGEKLPDPEPVVASAPTQETEKGQKKASESDPESKEAKNDITDEHEDSEEESGKQDDSAKDKPKKKGGIQRRIDKLNARVTAREQEIEYWKQEAMKQKTSAPDSKTEKVDSKPAAAEGKPKSESFETHAEFVEALTDWKTEQKLKERDQKAEKNRLETEQAKLTNTYSERAKSFSEKTPDFQEVLTEVDHVRISPAVEQMLVSSENGPEIAYELAKNPEEFERINKLPPLAAAREIGKIETRLAIQASKETKPEQKTTQAPKPIAPVGGGKSAVVHKTPEEMSFSEYEKYRREQMRRKR